MGKACFVTLNEIKISVSPCLYCCKQDNRHIFHACIFPHRIEWHQVVCKIAKRFICFQFTMHVLRQ